MVHLRIVAPAALTKETLEILERSPAVRNLIVVPGAGRRPPGDVVMCDVPRGDASAVIADLRALGVERDGSIVAASAPPVDAVAGDGLAEPIVKDATLSFTFVALMVIAALIAAVGIYLDSPVLIVGAVVLGPAFGPLAGICIALNRPPRSLAVRSLAALAMGFPVAIIAVFWITTIFKATGVTPDTFSAADHGLSSVIASSDFLVFFVAFLAGVAGMLSLRSARSVALVGVLVSLTTIPAAANIGVSAAYADWPSFRGSLTQLGLALVAILVAGTLTLAIQRAVDDWRQDPQRDEALDEPASEEQSASVA